MAGKHPNPSAPYPYRPVRNPNMELTGYGALSVAEKQALFDEERGVPTRDERLAVRVDDMRIRDAGLPAPGVVGGQVPIDEDPYSYVNKSNYNPPTSNMQLVNESLLGSGLPKDYENSPPVPITLALLLLWARAQNPDPLWKRKDGSDWTPPACTVGVLRSRATGKITGWVPCNAWSCATCGPIKRDRLSKAATAAFGDQPVWFLTLNLRVPKGKQSVLDSNPMVSDGFDISGYVPQEEIARCWQRFRSILSKPRWHDLAYKRAYKSMPVATDEEVLARDDYLLAHADFWIPRPSGPMIYVSRWINKHGVACHRLHREKMPEDGVYFYVKEFSPPPHRDKRGVVTAGHRRHYHILMNFDIPEDVIREAWWYATNKTSTNVKMIQETDEFGKLRPSYITKYINKSMSDDTFVADYLPLERRYGKSVGFFTMAFPSLGLSFFQPLVKSTRAYDEAVHDPDKLPQHFSRQHPLG